VRKYQGNLLVVDDFELNRDMLSRRLQTRGFSVQSADCGVNALTAIDQMPELDLVLLDIMMPDLDGYEILRRIREKFTSSELAVIMVTAKDQSEDIVRALQLGADDYITKPIDFPVALARISNQLCRRVAENALRESEERYSLAARGANDGLWDWDLRKDQVYYSDRWKTMLGLKVNECGETIDEWFNRVHPDDLIRLKKEVEEHLQGHTGQLSCEYRMACPEGWRWMLTRGIAVKDEAAHFYRMAGWQTDTAQRVEHDRLTSLPNRGLFLDRLSSAVSKAQRNPVESFAVFYMGLDRFKIINETLGHERGDVILQQVAKLIEELVRPQDTLARMGGDEFALLVEGMTSLGSATLIAERIKASIMSESFKLGEDEAHVTISIGIVLPGNQEDGRELLRMAHSTMELAKSRGKDTYEFYQESMDAGQVAILKMENRLRKALDNNELFLMYQPQIDTQSGRIIGAEALLRWQNADEGLVPPYRFIPLAEETGLIEPIGEWVIREACRQNKVWQDAGLPPIRVAVNVSARQFRNAEGLLGVVEAALKSSLLEAHWLDIEITEGVLMVNVEETRNYLNRFHKLGCHLSLDDFGTGYSSLSYLKKFPIDTLKIDQSFVRDITTDMDDAAICSAVISMAHSLRMEVIAEGVETLEGLKFLKTLHCDQMQGYYFSRPTSPEEIARLLANNTVYQAN